MEALYLSITNCLGIEAIEENDEDKGVFIEEMMIYKDLADPDPANAELID